MNVNSEGQNDEADQGRTQKRALAHEQSVKFFLDYFNKNNRLVTVNASCGDVGAIWAQLSQFVTGLKYRKGRSVHSVVVFAWDEKSLQGLSSLTLNMEKISLKELAPDPSEPPAKLLHLFVHYMDQRCHETNSFVLVCEGTSLVPEALEKFHDTTCHHSSRYVGFLSTVNTRVEMSEFLKKIDAANRDQLLGTLCSRFKAFFSLENELCLFPKDASDHACSAIASTIDKLRAN